MKPFVHLHNHTAYSLLDGAGKIEDEVKRAAALGMPALAITDHGVMYGAVEFYRACKKHGIKPIIGCEVYVARHSRFDTGGGREESPYHLILLVENEIGYRNLCKLVSLASIEGFYYKPRIDRELLAMYHEGLIAMSACLGGELPQAILAGRMDDAMEAARWYKALFGADRYYLEVQNHGLAEQITVNQGLAAIADELALHMVATNDNHYVLAEDAAMQDVMLCIQTGKTLADTDRMQFEGDQFYIKSYDEMLAALPEYPESLDNTVRIAERCQFDFTLGVNFMPEFSTPHGESLKEYLAQLCERGLRERYDHPDADVQQRLAYELTMIDKMGYNSYFLIVWDFIDYAKRQGIYVGPGRGSAAGSLVSYVLGITDIDPIRYELLFERFLNPERVNMPDIDIDFCYERRGEVIEYVTEKYGADHVAQIITFGTMAAKGAVRDVGRVMDIPLSTVNKISKLIPNELGITLERAIHASQELQEWIENDEDIAKLMHMAGKLEGMPRHAGTHAAGVVIAQEPMEHYLPLQKTADGAIITQFSKDDVEDIGLLKMDFLGLRTLTVINKTIENIKKRYDVTIDFSTIDENDPPTYKMLSDGDSIGIFQLEGSGLRSVLKELKPETLEDIIALVALYRPGPLGSGMVDDFIQRKHGQKEIEYLDPALETILKPSYGVILYQEQVMQIASRLAGFSLGEADLLRRAMGKKKPEIIANLKAQFIEGASQHHIQAEVAEAIFQLIEHFAGYGFNKSHSAAYAVLAFQTAYLKHHYTKEFMAEMLNSYIDNIDKVTFYIAECRRLGIPILPPDINESGTTFTVTDRGIRFGLHAIKGVGMQPVELICKVRQDAPFTSFQDFCTRVDMGGTINKRLIENLINCGAFSGLGQRKKALVTVMDECIAQAHAIQKQRNSNQVSFFDLFEDPGTTQSVQVNVPEIEEYTSMETLRLEKELLGIYVSGHPLDAYAEQMARFVTVTIGELKERQDGKRIMLGGMLSDIRFQTTKKGELMAYATLEDMQATIELLIFPRSLNDTRDMLIEDAAVFVTGRLNCQEDEKKLFVETIESMPRYLEKYGTSNAPASNSTRLQDEAKRQSQRVFVRFQTASSAQDAEVFDLQQVLQQHSGTVPVYCFFQPTRKVVLLEKRYWIEPKTGLQAVEAMVGADNVSLKIEDTATDAS